MDITMLRTSTVTLFLAFMLILGGLFYVAKYQRPPFPGKHLPKTPQTIRIATDQLADALENAPWVSPGLDGTKLYAIGYRACKGCISYQNSEFEDLHAAGIDTRVILFARRALSYTAERAVIADLACTREWPIYQRWMADKEEMYYERYGTPPAPEGDTRRKACLDWSRIVHDRLAGIMADNGWAMETPALFWQNAKGEWRFFVGDSAQGKRMIRRELGVPPAKK